jgi:hypothetical protein
MRLLRQSLCSITSKVLQLQLLQPGCTLEALLLRVLLLLINEEP